MKTFQIPIATSTFAQPTISWYELIAIIFWLIYKHWVEPLPLSQPVKI